MPYTLYFAHFTQKQIGRTGNYSRGEAEDKMQNKFAHSFLNLSLNIANVNMQKNIENETLK